MYIRKSLLLIFVLILVLNCPAIADEDLNYLNPDGL